MKKSFIRIIALTLVLVTVGCVLISCAPSGKYEGDLYTFDFKSSKKVSATSKVTGATYEGTFEMGKDKDKNDTITFTFENLAAVTLNGTHSYVKEKNYIQIDGIKYIKK